MPRVFISYSRQDRAYVEQLAAHLQAGGVDAWFDREIAYSAQWWQTIVDEIRRADAVVLVMTTTLEESEWSVKEVLLARRESKPIFPLLLEGQGLPLVIDIQHVDVSDRSMPPDSFVSAVRGRQTPSVESDRSEVRLDDVARELERQEETLAAADRALGDGQATARAHAVRARALNELRRGEDALAAAEAGLALSPDDASALLEKARALEMLDEDAAALTIADSLLQREPASTAAMVVKAWALIGNDNERAREWADRALAIEPRNAEALAGKSATLFLDGQLGQARAMADAAIAARPGSPYGYACKALGLAMSGELEEAKGLFDNLCLIYPYDHELAGGPALVFLAKQDLAGAERSIRRAIQLAPRSYGSYQQLALILQMQGRLEEALAATGQAERGLPQDQTAAHADLFVRKGQILRQLGRHSDARAAFHHAHRLDPQAPGPLLGQALLALSVGELDEGKRLLDLAYDQNREGSLDDISDEVEEAASQLSNEGNYEPGLILLDALVAHGRPSFDVQVMRGASLISLGRYDEALALAQHIVRGFGSNRDGPYVLMSSALLQLGRPAEALAAADQAIALNDPDPFAHTLRAQALRAQGRRWEALKEEMKAQTRLRRA